MELSTDLWSFILQKTRSIQNCDKLYSALPSQIRTELKKTYNSHKESLNLKIIIAFQNRVLLYNSDHLEKEVQLAVKRHLMVREFPSYPRRRVESLCFGTRLQWN